jgi:NAD(P)-dependent dehydrogenase (short-subunit alcohol dehydrogenase family)
MESLSASTTIVLITGANQGLGYECVKKLAAEQPNFRIIIGSRDIAKGHKAVSAVSILAQNTAVETVQLEVTSDESITKAAEYVNHKYGRLDVLFNNAGTMFVQEPTFRAEMQKIIDTNAISAACITEKFMPLLQKAVVPRLLFMSSGLGSLGYTQLPFSPYYNLDFKAYSASKAALNMIGALYAVKYHKDGVKVNMIDPGFRSTNLNGFNEQGADPADGAVEACRLMVDNTKDGQHGTFTATAGLQPW